MPSILCGLCNLILTTILIYVLIAHNNWGSGTCPRSHSLSVLCDLKPGCLVLLMGEQQHFTGWNTRLSQVRGYTLGHPQWPWFPVVVRNPLPTVPTNRPKKNNDLCCYVFCLFFRLNAYISFSMSGTNQKGWEVWERKKTQYNWGSM